VLEMVLITTMPYRNEEMIAAAGVAPAKAA